MKFLIHENFELYGNHNQCTDFVITGASTSYGSKLLNPINNGCVHSIILHV